MDVLAVAFGAYFIWSGITFRNATLIETHQSPSQNLQSRCLLSTQRILSRTEDQAGAVVLARGFCRR